MVPAFLLATVVVAAGPGDLTSLSVGLYIDPPRELQLGDVLYVKVVIKNTGKEPVVIPGTFTRPWGTLRFQFYDGDSYLYTFWPDGAGMGGSPKRPLEPGEVRVLHDRLRVPRIDRLEESFWKLQPGFCSVTAFLKVGKYVELRSRGQPIVIVKRPSKELTAIKEFYDGGIFKKRDWPDNRDRYRPCLYHFGLGTFPIHVNTPEKLAAFEQALSPGTLRNVVHLTRLAQQLYDGKDDPERAQQAADALDAWLAALPPIEREWLSNAMFDYCTLVRPDPPMLDLAERLVPRLPEQWMGIEGYREEARETIRKTRHYREQIRSKAKEPRSPQDDR